MNEITPEKRLVRGQIFGLQTIYQLPAHLIFKGKIYAAARRAKFHDSADLRWLENNCSTEIQKQAHTLPLEEIGLAIKRYAILERAFLRLNVNVEAAKRRTAAMDLKELPTYQKGDVQASLLAPPTPLRVLHL